jgi:aryl-alcohol dehydrogenase-like predicted oxidoreductase
VDTPIQETVAAMTDLVRQGKVMYWGTSEWNAQQITEAWAFAKAENMVAPVVEQPEYNLFNRGKVEGDYTPLYDLMGLGLTTWSPLSSGLLTGKYINGVPAGSRLSLPEYQWLREQKMGDDNRRQLDKVQQLAQLAQSLNVPMHHLALNWCLANQHVSSVILGVSKMIQLEDNLTVRQTAGVLTSEVMQQLDDIMGNKPNEAQRF